jgi:hypothetical protein
VIDHSTTTLEAAGHTGGNSGKGGDILYRWGNPVAYRAGTDEDQKFFQQHDVRWIKPGCPGEGNILVFNNGNGRPGTDYTTVDEIVTPVDEDGNYYLEPGSAYGPEEQIWIYDSDFFAFYVGGAQRLPDGNTLICNAPSGEFIEVTPEKAIVWEYENPYPNPVQNNLFTFKYFPPDESPQEEPNLDCEGNLQWNNIKPGVTVNGNFLVKNIGEPGSLLNWEIKTESIDWGNWTFEPVFGVNLTPEDGPVTVQVSVVVPDEENSEYEGFIRVENQDDSEDFDVVPVYLTIPRSKIDNKLILNYLKQHTNILPFIQILLKILEKQKCILSDIYCKISKVHSYLLIKFNL